MAELDRGRLAYVLALIGPADVSDDDDGWSAYANDIADGYARDDLEDDPLYAAFDFTASLHHVQRTAQADPHPLAEPIRRLGAALCREVFRR